MMRNTIWLMGLTALLGTLAAQGLPTLAQAGGAPAGQHQKLGQLKKLAAYLGLTADQKAQIKPIMKNAAQQVRTVREDASLTPAQKKAKVKEIRQASRQQIMMLLTPEQKAKLAALRQDRKSASGA